MGLSPPNSAAPRNVKRFRLEAIAVGWMMGLVACQDHEAPTHIPEPVDRGPPIQSEALSAHVLSVSTQVVMDMATGRGVTRSRMLARVCGLGERPKPGQEQSFTAQASAEGFEAKNVNTVTVHVPGITPPSVQGVGRYCFLLRMKFSFGVEGKQIATKRMPIELTVRSAAEAITIHLELDLFSEPGKGHTSPSWRGTWFVATHPVGRREIKYGPGHQHSGFGKALYAPHLLTEIMSLGDELPYALVGEANDLRRDKKK